MTKNYTTQQVTLKKKCRCSSCLSKLIDGMTVHRMISLKNKTAGYLCQSCSPPGAINNG